MRERQRLLWHAWTSVNLSRPKRLPPLMPMLKALEQERVMTDKDIRTTIIGMAQVMGAKVTYKKRGDA